MARNFRVAGNRTCRSGSALGCGGPRAGLRETGLYVHHGPFKGQQHEQSVDSQGFIDRPINLMQHSSFMTKRSQPKRRKKRCVERAIQMGLNAGLWIFTFYGNSDLKSAVYRCNGLMVRHFCPLPLLYFSSWSRIELSSTSVSLGQSHRYAACGRDELDEATSLQAAYAVAASFLDIHIRLPTPVNVSESGPLSKTARTGEGQREGAGS